MKTYHSYNLKIIGVLFLALVSGTNMLWSQSLVKSSAPVNPYYSSSFSESNGNLLIGTGNLGIGTITPTARLHIYSANSFPTQPLFHTEVRSSFGTWLASIQNCVNINGQNYGIYQTSPGNTQLLNYFQDRVKIGNMLFYSESPNEQSFLSLTNINSIRFLMAPTVGLNPVNPLTITTDSIKVKGKLVTDEFQLLSHPGINYILASDAYGNGTWIDPSPYINDYWQPNGLGDIYTNYRRVGIGTNRPSRSLEICHTDNTGGIVLNQISTDPNINATELRFERSGVEKFATGYNKDYTDPDHPRDYYFVWSNIDNGNGSPLGTVLFIDGKNGMTGIGTSWPSARLEVNGNFKATAVGIGVDPPPSWDSYKVRVDGGIAAREIKVTAGTLPDFVFEKGYKLLTLVQLENYINKNKHLPDIPSQANIDKDGGIEVGDFQKKLLQKIEEQTIYILSLQKQIDELRENLKTK